MPQSPRPSPSKSARKALKISCAFSLLTTLAIMGWRYTHRPAASDAALDRSTAGTRPQRPLPIGYYKTEEERMTWRQRMNEWLATDGRVLEEGIAATARGFTTRTAMRLALDEVALLSPQSGFQLSRIQPQKDRRALNSVLHGDWKGTKSAYPVLYPEGVERTAATARIVTGQLVAVLKPGVNPQEIAREYELKPVEGVSPAGLVRFVAKTAIAALEQLPKIARDARIAMIDHDLISSTQPKSVFPNDPYFPDQWNLLPGGPSELYEAGAQNYVQSDSFNLNLYPRPVPITWSSSAPVWGDFAIEGSGVRGRGVRVGIVDDGLETTHPDFAPSFDGVGHHGYDLIAQTPTVTDPNPPPLVQASTGDFAAQHQTFINLAHGTAMGGVVAALANNQRGTVGVAPEATLVGIRAHSYYVAYDATGSTPLPAQAPVDGQQGAQIGNLLAPTCDIVVAAALEYLVNPGAALSVSSKTVYEGTPYEKIIPAFADQAGDFEPIPIKLIGFGAPDFNLIDGPGPETAGYRNVMDPTNYQMGSRARAARFGRNGLGTIFIAPAGNGRMLMDNSNNDGYASAPEVIAVGGLSRIGVGRTDSTNVDHSEITSERGANVMVTAPLGSRYLGAKRARPNFYESQLNYATPQVLESVNGVPALITIPTTDWTLNQPSTPPHNSPTIYGFNDGTGQLNVGNGLTNYDDGAWHRGGSGTSFAAAQVAGVVALMLEANPRLSWLDVQDILIRTARNHLLPGTAETTPSPMTGDDNVDQSEGIDPQDYKDIEPLDRDWFKNGGNIWFNHKYGAGLVDARRAVDRAIRGHLIPPQTDIMSGVPVIPSALLTQTIEFGGPRSEPFEYIFNVPVPERFHITQVTLYIGEGRGDTSQLQIKLTSPSGMESILLEGGSALLSQGFAGHTFTTFRHWGESGAEQGTNQWKLTATSGLPFVFNPPSDDPNNPTPINSIVLTVNGFIKPNPPEVREPASTDPASPTIVEWPLADHDSYTMRGSNDITRWHVFDGSGQLPDPNLRAIGTPQNNPTSWIWLRDYPYATGENDTFVIGDGSGKPGLPQGLSVDSVTPSADTTYLPSLAIRGRITDKNVKVGDKFDLVVSAANYSGETELRYLRLLVVPGSTNDAYTNWARSYFGETAADNPDAYGSADSDGDGASNALEYALGLHPGRGDSEKAWTAEPGEDNSFTISFNRYLERECVYEIQSSETLEEGSWTTVVKSDYRDDGGAPKAVGPGTYDITEGTDIEDAEPFSKHRLVTVKLPPTEAPRYYRLLVTPYSNDLRPKP